MLLFPHLGWPDADRRRGMAEGETLRETDRLAALPPAPSGASASWVES